MAAPVPGQPKSQLKDDPSTKKGFKRYKWEFKDSNKEFWTSGHAELKLLSL
ncbi:CKLF-like MARVEL transmembrane domain-containing protein 2, partial [Sigmodon hispidus]